ncbi:peptidoglycan editing factor PgeF [Amorphus coralli]|uniref:peptidoglycan editing factor PgeF n=1 Tax=Amorphus coralli TaxID=340680 RepID=UPI0003684186|nr:peptidoglycan editing factor PgeF [Amorphus coralli]
MITARELAGFDDIRHGFFTREGGVSDGIYASLNVGFGSKDEQTAVAENRKRVADRLGVAADRLVTPYQIHSPTALTVDGPWPDGERPRGDAVVTATPGVAVGVATADCGPVLFADPGAQVVAAAHAGWRGAVGGVLESTIWAMEALGARRAATVASLGPTISQASYEVGPDFIQQLLDEDLANERYFAPAARPGHAMFDLPRYIEDRLRAAGIGTVGRLDACTYSEPDRFYSYRRSQHRNEPDYGRLISAIAIVPR